MSPLFAVLRKQSFATTGIYLLILALCLAISATTALKFSHEKIQNAVTLQAAKMQAADVVVSDQFPIADEWRNKAQQLQLQQSEVTMFSSMAHTQDQFVMVNVKAIQPNFPLRGEIQVQPAATQLKSGEVWLSQRAMDLLGVKLSDHIQIADGSFEVTAVVLHDSNQEMGFSGFSPTVLINQADVAKTNAIQIGSRVDYRLLLAGEAEPIQQYIQAFKKVKWAREKAQQQAQEKALQQSQQQALQTQPAQQTNPVQAAQSAQAQTPEVQNSSDHKTADQNSAEQNSADQNSTEQNNAEGADEDSKFSTLKLRTAEQANARLMKPIENLDLFLQLATMLTILLCGIAIALSSQRYVQQSQDHIALLRCMGASRGGILKAYALLLLLVVLIATLIGSVLGMGLAYVLLQLMLQLIPQLQFSFSVLDMLMGPLPIAILTSAVLLLGFVMPSLWQLLNTAPVRVLRQQSKSAKSWILQLTAGVLSLIVFSLLLTENFSLTAMVIGAILLLSGLLYALVWLILKTIKALKNRLSSYVGAPAQTALQITALALGLSLIAVLLVLRTDLLERWQQQLPANTPNQFVYGLPPFELAAFKQQIAAKNWQGTPLYPNIRGRLIEKNGQPFSPALIKQNNALRRELNLTQTDHYPADNLIVAGTAGLQQAREISVEAKLAAELGIQIGDRLSFSLPEGQIEGRVVNLRDVEWQSFSPNFFFIFAPNSLDENAGSYLGSFYVPTEQKSQMIGLIQQFSNTVFVDVSLILEEVKRLVDVLVQVVTLLAILVSVSGFMVLVACINLLLDARKKQVALLRSFGSSKRQLKNMMTIEIGFMGMVAGIAACLFAEVISAIVAYKMNLALQLHGQIWLILPILMTLLSALIGRYRLSYLAELPPLQSLRTLN
ncbi:putative ABC transport system permease protein [Acinetobacter calcoaceticus]|uniref:Putative ABC transport system permease protein n=1 Tax=Acinetobacter calcoaceticus TaxID=471 RepID=A0A4R1XQ78_ACICA|nr:putative ABC transport system permease protein [Acinetobacter calcoaceticus]